MIKIEKTETHGWEAATRGTRMKKYFYLSCMGNIYSSLELIDGYDEPCPICGDSDEYVGYFETEDEALESYYHDLYDEREE